MARNVNKSISVLIVDDNPDDIIFYKHLLTSSVLPKEKYKVFASEDSNEAFALCKENDIDVFILDYNLPGENGVTILGKLQKLYPEKPLAVILLTGEANQHVQAEAARQGAMDYIVKDTTTTPEGLDQVIEKIIDWSQKNKCLA